MKKIPVRYYPFYRLFSNIFQRYFLRSLFITTLSSGLILSFFIAMVQSLRYCAMMAYQGLSLADVFYLSCHLLPKTFVVGLSWGFVIGMIWVYQRWSSENAINIMQSCGMSSWFFNQPTYFLSLCLMGILYTTTLYIIPITARISHQYTHHIQGRINPSFITAGVYCSFPGHTLYVHKHPSRYHLEGVFLHRHEKRGKEMVLCGQSAYIIPNGYGFFIHFDNGTIQIFSKNKPAHLAHFKKYTFHYKGPKKLKKHSDNVKIDELSWFSLWQHWQHPSLDILWNKSVEKELVYRLFYPTLPLLDALWIPPFLLQGGRILWPLLIILLILHGGMLSSFAGWILWIALMSRWIFWIRKRNVF